MQPILTVICGVEDQQICNVPFCFCFQDELTPNNVKMGFSYSPQISEEYGTARHTNWNKDKMMGYFNSILTQRIENNLIPDQGKRKLQVNTRDNFYLVSDIF